MTALIMLNNICKIYKNGCVHALRDISLHVAEGQFLSIIGTSGSGKTTLMQILGCLDSATSGEYLLGGQDVSQLSANALAVMRGEAIGFVFQSFRLSPDLNALENVALPLLFRGVPRKEREMRAAAALERVGLGARMKHRPCALSGGQQQRVAIARAVCGNPRVLLADEPTGNLDPRASAEILCLFDELHKAGHTIVLITHDTAVAKRAERTVAIENGKLICGSI